MKIPTSIRAIAAIAAGGWLAASFPAVAQSGANVLPHELSPWAMFLAADLVVKGVILGLAFASVVTWTVALFKLLEVGAHERRLRQATAALDRCGTLAQALAALDGRQRVGRVMLEAAAAELRLSADQHDRAGIKERVASRLARIEAAAGRSMNKGTGLLATIGSTAPFVGLFGTVWGIMNSFVGISKAQTTNLAVVAPGIAEALLATAIGLAAAIPAVVIYNHFSRAIGGYRARVADLSAVTLRLVSRELGRGPHTLSIAAE
jgi:biopolymer transport protein ExbB